MSLCGPVFWSVVWTTLCSTFLPIAAVFSVFSAVIRDVKQTVRICLAFGGEFAR